MANSELVNDEKKDTSAGFWVFVHQFFTGVGINIEDVKIDKGFLYCFAAFADAIGQISHVRANLTDRKRAGMLNVSTARSSENVVTLTHISATRAGTVNTERLRSYLFHRRHNGIGRTRPSDRAHNLTSDYITYH